VSKAAFSQHREENNYGNFLYPVKKGRGFVFFWEGKGDGKGDFSNSIIRHLFFHLRIFTLKKNQW
jgi:hypothetical protein